MFSCSIKFVLIQINCSAGIATCNNATVRSCHCAVKEGGGREEDRLWLGAGKWTWAAAGAAAPMLATHFHCYWKLLLLLLFCCCSSVAAVKYCYICMHCTRISCAAQWKNRFEKLTWPRLVLSQAWYAPAIQIFHANDRWEIWDKSIQNVKKNYIIKYFFM